MVAIIQHISVINLINKSMIWVVTKTKLETLSH